MEPHTVTDDELAEHLNAVIAEQERRAALERIQGQIATLRQQYVDGGGDITGLDAIPA